MRAFTTFNVFTAGNAIRLEGAAEIFNTWNDARTEAEQIRKIHSGEKLDKCSAKLYAERAR